MRVAIVGGGVSGLFIAYTLAKRGIDVVVLEKEYIGAGSSGRCATGIRASFTSREHVVLMKESIRLWQEYSRGELGRYGLQFVQSGYLWVIRREETLDLARKLVEFHNSLGVPTRIVDSKEISRLVPYIDTDIVIGAIHDPIAGKSYPFTTLFALYRACRDLGVDIRMGVEVRKLVARDDKIVALEASTGSIEADVFVIAAGSGSRDLLRSLGIELPIEDIPRHVLVTEAYRRAFDPLVIDWDTPGVPYIVQTAEGNFFIGRNLADKPGRSLYLQRIDFIPRALKPMVELFPFLKNVRVLRYWIGYYVTTPDHHPIYGPIPPYENLYIATGFSGHGYMMGPVTGVIIADWILRGRPSLREAERLTIDRFKRGELIKEIAIVG